LINKGLMTMLKMIAALCAGLTLLVSPAMAQQVVPWPPLIKIVAPFAAGSTADATARAVASGLAKRVGSTVIVENQPGASTFIGTAAVVKGPKDGSVMLLTSTSTFAAAATKRTVPVDVATDLIPVAMLSAGPLTVAASAASNIKTPADLVAAARAKPNGITYGTGGVGSNSHIAAELLNDAAHIQLMHVPYKSGSLVVPDLAAGRIDLTIGTYATVASQVKTGKVRLVAVTTAQPDPAFPGVPTMASAAPGFSIDNWVGIFVAAGTPPAVIKRLNHELNEIAKSGEMRQVMELDGFVPSALSPEEFGSRVRDTYAGFKKIAAVKSIEME
jgi:tripartite-type tricarboxylate transporter receptor subunit TctC